MMCVIKAVILLLVFNALHVHSKSVLKTEKIDEVENRLSIESYNERVCDCGPGGTCSFLDGEQICTCFKGFEEENKKCIEKCTTNDNCNSTQKCMEKSGRKTCICADGLGGTNCEVNVWCQDENKYKNCKEENGTCTYSEQDRTVVCTCVDGRALHPEENRCRACDCGPKRTCSFLNGRKLCRCFEGYAEANGKCIETCSSNDECGYDGECINDGEHGFCSCKPGIIGDKCNIIFDCTAGGKYKDCIDSGGLCSYDVESQKSICKCPNGKKLHDTKLTCEACDCGLKGTCEFRDGLKICTCFQGYAKINEICIECNCGPYGSCTYEYGQKKCNCLTFAIEKHGVCVVVETTSSGGTTSVTSTILPSTPEECNCGPYGSCKFEYGQKKCDCKSFAIEKNGLCIIMETTWSESTSTVTPTILTSTVQDCNCGSFAHSCTMNSKNNKVCKCFLGYSQLGGSCAECNCGVNAQSCSFRRNGTKVCNCDFGYIQMNGQCSAICNEDKCVHGKCQKVGDSFLCRCNEGYTGNRCEEKIQTNNKKQDLWQILQVSLMFATFVLLSGMLCILISKKYKK